MDAREADGQYLISKESLGEYLETMLEVARGLWGTHVPRLYTRFRKKGGARKGFCDGLQPPQNPFLLPLLERSE